MYCEPEGTARFSISPPRQSFESREGWNHPSPRYRQGGWIVVEGSPCMRRSNPQPRQDPNVSLCLYFTSLASRLPLLASRLSWISFAAKVDETSSSNVTFISVIISRQDGSPSTSIKPLVDSYSNMTEPMYGSPTHFPPTISPSPRPRPIEAN